MTLEYEQLLEDMEKERQTRLTPHFTLDEERIAELPEQLVCQASAIARKVLREIVLVEK